MTDDPIPGELEIIEEYFSAWLDAPPSPAPDEGDSTTGTLSSADDHSFGTRIDRASRCAEMIAQRWPRPAAGSMRRDQDGALAPTFDAGLRAEFQVGRFLLRQELGRGRFGIVYRAYDPRLGREVAIKVARPEVARSSDLSQRFLRETSAAARLVHPGIVPVLEPGENDQYLYYVMPYFEGCDLAKYLQQTPTPVDQRLAADVIRQLAEAVNYGHTQGIIHRDLKPANVLLVPTATAQTHVAGSFHAKILDFGLSRSSALELQDTRSSVILGTPLYMSPEQAKRGTRDVGSSTDIFALGAILYELLCGEPPFAADSFPKVMERLAACDPVPPSRRRRNVDPRLEHICLKCLRLYPEDRYATARALAEDLGRFLRGEPVLVRRAGWLDHLRWWGRRSQRIAEAGIALFSINFALAVSMLLLCLGPLIDPDASMAAMQVRTLFVSLVPGALAALFVAGIGIRVARGSQRALWVGTVAVSLQWTICMSILFGGAPAYGMYLGNPFAKWVMHLLLLSMFTLELLMCLVAHYAHRAADAARI